MEGSLRRQVRDRANDICEYCQLPAAYDLLPFQIDHVIAEKHHGPTNLENLAWSCCNCNAFKGANIGGLVDGVVTRLFHPRRDIWAEHFAWDGPHLLALTAIGHATIDVLNINQPERVEHRRLLAETGLINLA